ncbi:FAD-dependent oxidoreductase [Caballeronia sordidicola]|uniref:FAD-dependent oxidoreductase n=1 Tax=Caballeronia sordidicola TaxID=196367 RepID=UPI000A367DE1|nr:FAD-dependent oxidoreductase [Caballeronia sordidicola]
MDVIVIGGGIGGIATAYQLRAAGHRVCVVERHATVAQGATYGHGGAILPSPLDVWFGPTFMQTRRAAKTGVVFKPGFDSETREFAKKLTEFHDPHRFATQYGALRPLVDSSRDAIAEIEAEFPLDFEQRTGVLHVFRHERDLELTDAAIKLMQSFETPHRLLTAQECVAAEPSIPEDPPLAGGVLLPDARTANCPLFTKLLKQVLEDDGVQFRLGREVTAIRVEAQRAAVELAPLSGALDGKGGRSREVELIGADAIVVAAGTGTPALLATLGISLPLHPLRLHTLTAPIAYEERAPHLTIVDSVKRIAMTRINQRMRVTGGAVLQSIAKASKPMSESLTHRALALLGQATHDWIPGAAKVSAARAWDGIRLISPDGLPVVSATSHARLFVNTAHGPAGWGIACGAARLIAALVSHEEPDVPERTLRALRIDRF